ncbi:Hypoxia up-regulated protein 1 [Zancudomyces culisetae]|uniref:Hypoxia up-regulated protein 1 n=1 Tax=Zancudomyces culisetae TaxID=1213189 RepID=A0A1R1PVA4_ZANCU|nr:Hypoxia up-regulated protein 1 [Zancudomyces culisetae]|eukprot:OMH84863.1 Hypoxia up-regulated protein 1 [Zancudomyces culisetae]
MKIKGILNGFAIPILLAIGLVNVWLAEAAVFGIDYGADTFKLAVAIPGKAFDLVLNRESKRKTPSVMAIKNNERIFGSEAVSVSGKHSAAAFAAKYLLGAKEDDEVVQVYKSRYGADLVKKNQQGDLGFDFNLEGIDMLTVQETIAMQLQYMKKLAKETEKVDLKDAVIAIPSHFGQEERQAMADAAELAGIRVLSFINDGTAVALNYAMTRAFNSTIQIHMFVDVGAASTVVTVASFTNEMLRDKSGSSVRKPASIVNTLGYAMDKTLGGFEMDGKLRAYIVKQFTAKKGEKLGEKLRNDRRAMARLLKEATKIKTILSVNPEISVSLESIVDDHDFYLKIQRKEFEGLITDLGPRIRKTVKDAVEMANINMKDINSIVVVGGGTRVPFVKEQLAELFGAEKISKNVNADESCVLGSVFKAAGMSLQFRVRDIRVRDAYGYGIRAVYKKESGGMLDFKNDETTVDILPRFSTIGAKRFIRQSRNTDFSIKFEAESAHAKGYSQFATAEISGVTDAISKRKGKKQGTEKPEIEVAVRLNKYGLFEVTSANAVFNITNPAYPKYVEDLKNWNAEQAEHAKKLKEQSSSSSSSFSSASSSTGTNSSTGTADTTTEKTATESKPTTAAEFTRPIPKEEFPFILEKEPLQIKFSLVHSNKLHADTVSRFAELVKKMDSEEDARNKLSEARNNLESYIYESRDFIDYQDAGSFSTSQEIEALTELLKSTSEWLDSNADPSSSNAVGVDTYVEKLGQVKAAVEPVKLRVSESSKRPEAINELSSIVNKTLDFHNRLVNGAKDNEQDSKDISGLIDELSSLLDSAKEYLSQVETKVKALLPHDNPTVLSSEITETSKKFSNKFVKLVAKLASRRQKTKPSQPTISTKLVDETKPSETTQTTQTTQAADSSIPDEPSPRSRSPPSGDQEHSLPRDEL